MKKTGDKVVDAIGPDTKQEMDSEQSEQLRSRIISAETAMKQVQEELESNPKYQELKEQLSALTQGKKEVNKRQKAIIAYALRLLEEKSE